MRKTLVGAFLLLAVLVLAFGACAEALNGQRYDTFLDYYGDDLTFINENDNRHLLPLVIAKRTSDEKDGRLFYEIFGDVLSLTIRTDPTGEVIEMCQIILTAPQGMEHGTALYNDFAISGYHSYALLMAMHTDPEAVNRYELVNKVVGGMAEGNGQFSTQVGLYRLVCTRVDNTATLNFENARLEATPEPVPDGSPDPDAAENPKPEENTGDEGAGLG